MLTRTLLLSPGDHIALIGPASPTKNSQIPATIKNYLETHYDLTISLHEHPHLWQTPSERARVFLEYLSNPQIKMLWAIRGGEGCADILPFLDQEKARIKNLSPKLIMGFSDITALLLYFEKLNWPVIHGIGAGQLIPDRVSADTLTTTLNFLFQQTTSWQIPLTPLNKLATKSATLSALVTGGNLSLLNISIKDTWEFNSTGKIVIIEDVNEKPHVVARTLKYLQRIGKFANANALILGDFVSSPIGNTAEEQTSNAKRIQQFFVDFARFCDFPVLQTRYIGHGKENLPILFNTLSTLQLGEHCQLQICVSS